MTKTQYYTATSIDGFIADEHNSLDWLMEVEGAADQIASESVFSTFFAQVGAFCMGATTYEWVMEHEGPDRWREMWGDVPGWVFTHRQLPSLGVNATFVAGDVEPVHQAMARAAAGKNIWLVGGGELVGRFADRGLLDEIILGIAPVSLGAGAPLLPRYIRSSRLTLTSVERLGAFASLTYAVGPVG